MIQLNQSGHMDQDGGYVDFVLDDRNGLYLRLYVGQSVILRGRIRKGHAANILRGSNSSLHYFIIWKGNGHRTANFLRLWHMDKSSGPKDELLCTLDRNILETIFAYIFQTLPQAILEDCFGDVTRNSGGSPGIGLNILSPLCQGAGVTSHDIGRAIQCLLDSPDPEIREYVAFRNQRVEQSLSRHGSHFLGSPILRPEMESALRASYQGEGDFVTDWIQSMSEPSHKSPLPHLTDLNEEVTRHFSVFGDAVCCVPPVGTPLARIGFILDSSDGPRFSAEINKQRLCMPWGIQEAGFSVNNSLVWTWDFCQYGETGGGSLTAGSPIQQQFEDKVKDLHQEIITSSKLKIIFLWGPTAENIICQVLFSNLTPSIIRLRGTTYHAWAYQNGARCLLLIRMPKCPSAPWSFHGGETATLSNLLRLAVVLTETDGCTPHFLEGCAALRALVERRRMAIATGTEAGPESLSEGERLWLSRKGFSSIQDLRDLEQAAGTLSVGLVALLCVLPRRQPIVWQQEEKKLKKHRPEGGFKPLPALTLERVKRRYSQKAFNHGLQHLELSDLAIEPSEIEAAVDPETGDDDCLLDATDHEADEDPTDIFESVANRPEDRIIALPGWMFKNRSKKPLVSRSGLRSRHIFKSPGEGWRSQTGVFRGKGYPVKMFLDRSPKYLTFAFLNIWPDKYCQDWGNGELLIYIDEQPGRRHDRIYALACDDDDPGRCLGLRIVNHPTNPATIDFWPQTSAPENVPRVNTLADILIEGACDEEIRERPRRYQRRLKGQEGL